MDNVINFLFNPSHEVPSVTVIVVLVVIAIILPKVFEFVRERRMEDRKGKKPPKDGGGKQ